MACPVYETRPTAARVMLCVCACVVGKASEKQPAKTDLHVSILKVDAHQLICSQEANAAFSQVLHKFFPF